MSPGLSSRSGRCSHFQRSLRARLWSRSSISHSSKFARTPLAERKLGNHLKEIRSSHNLTQAELALRAGVSRKTINTVENGVFIPSTLLALTLAQCLQMTVEELFYLTRE